MATNNAVNVGLAGSTGTGNFVGATSPTLITPILGAASATSLRLSAAAAILDTNGNTILGFTPTASSVNYFSIGNNITAGRPQLFATGSDTNIGLNILSKGLGAIGIFNSGDTTPAVITAFTPTASAVNYLTFAGSATGTPTVISNSGTDTNVPMTIVSKGISGVNIRGTGSNDNASTGYVGEYLSTLVLSGAPVSLVSTTAKTIVTLSLTAGDWDLWGELGLVGGATTTVTIIAASLSATTNTIATFPSDSGSFNQVLTTAGTSWTLGASVTGTPYLNLTPIRVSIAATTNYYLVANVAFAVSTCNAYGKLAARRRR